MLTDPAEIAASKEFAQLLADCGKKQEAVAAEIGDGVSQGTVWQWANGRLAIPARRAIDAARAVGGTPEAISVAFRDEAARHSHVREGAAQAYAAAQSHRVGIPLSTISDAMNVVRAYLEDRGLPMERATDPLLIKIALDLVSASPERLSVSNVITFKNKFTDRLSEVGHGGSTGERAAEAG